MHFFQDLPIKRKLSAAILGTTSAALLAACAAFTVYDQITFRQLLEERMTTLADVLAITSTATLQFQNKSDAEEILAALKAKPDVITACLYAGDGKLFATYARVGTAPNFPPQAGQVGGRFENDRFHLFRPVVLNGNPIGTIYFEASLQGMHDRVRSYVGISALVLIGSLVLAIPFSTWLQSLISTPILSLAETAKQVSERKDYSVRAKKQSRDELGLLTDSFNEMLTDIEQRTQALQKANASLQKAKDSLQAQTAQIVEGTSVLASSTSEILTATSQLASTASETAVAVSETTTTVEEVKQTARISSDKARHVADSSQKVEQISQSGRKSAEDAVEGMKRIRAQMESIAKSMVRLSEQSHAIGEIITSVDDISQQSNLLAVNAAIEAAKAGEHGRGFAVVAEAIKNLASQSKQATAQVRIILSDIQKATGAAVMATEQGTKVVEAGSIQSALAVESICQLADNIAEAAQSATQIAATSQQQFVGMEQVVGAMESIKLASQQTVASTKQADAAAKNLHQLGQKLKELVERVKF